MHLLLPAHDIRSLSPGDGAGTHWSCSARCRRVWGALPSLAGSGDQSLSRWMFLLLWNTFSGSYFAFTSASRQYVSSP